MGTYDETIPEERSPSTNTNENTELSNDGFDVMSETKTSTQTVDFIDNVEHSPQPPSTDHADETNAAFVEDKPNVFLGKPHSSYVPSGPRRSSSRSIKRPKFDDELVDTSALKRTSCRKSSESSPSDQRNKKAVIKQTTQSSSSTISKKKEKKMKPMPVPTDFGRWRPTDDLALISAVTQTCDLQTVHLAVQFSCKFTLKEIQDRWFALLYDPFVSRLAQQAMKALPSDVIEEILNNALWSRDEDCIVADINIADKPELEDFQKILTDNILIFHKSRTAKTIQDHWILLRHYQLLSCQHMKSMSSSTLTTLADMENKIVDDQIERAEDDTLNQELAVSDRACKREIKRLEKDIPHWEMLIENSGYVDGFKGRDINDDSLAILKGRILKYSITKNQVIIGRNCNDFDVDIDLSIEGPSLKISRQQGLILHEDGIFYLENCGKRTFYINGFPLATGQSARLVNDSMIEICCIKLLFLINLKDEDDDEDESSDEQNSLTKVKEKQSWNVKSED